MKVVWAWLVMLGIGVAVPSTQAFAGEVRVAVASNFLQPLKSLARDFEKGSGDTLTISAGSTGKLYAQIVNGAPFDVFLAAGEREPALLEEAGLGVAGSRFTYALGRLALWAPTLEGEQPAMAEVLKAGQYRRLSVANPATAPYGAASLEVLDKLGLKSELQAKIIQGESISQAYQYTATGAAELGFVALAQVKAPGDAARGKVWLVDNTLHAPLRQQAVLLKSGKFNTAAKRFLQFLQSVQGRKAIESFGYGLE